MEERLCPVCASTDVSHVFAAERLHLDNLNSFAFASRKLPEYMNFRLIECPGCDLVYATPIFTPEHAEEAYNDASFDSGVEAAYAARTYARYLTHILPRLPDRAGALDIGTGDGAFLQELIQAGFTGVVGVEPSAAPIAAAPETVKPLIRHTVFREEDFEPESFRLITCFQTVEHMHGILDMAQSMFRLLKPGGAVFIICHNRRGTLNTMLGARSPIRDIEHLQLFSPSSLTALLTRSGFGRIRIRPIVNCYPISYWMRLSPLSVRAKEVAARGLRALRLDTVPLSVPVGNLMGVGYKPIA